MPKEKALLLWLVLLFVVTAIVQGMALNPATASPLSASRTRPETLRARRSGSFGSGANQSTD